jgi:hypothetical protein
MLAEKSECVDVGKSRALRRLIRERSLLNGDYFYWVLFLTIGVEMTLFPVLHVMVPLPVSVVSVAFGSLMILFGLALRTRSSHSWGLLPIEVAALDQRHRVLVAARFLRWRVEKRREDTRGFLYSAIPISVARSSQSYTTMHRFW